MAGKRKWTVEILGDAGSLAKAAKQAEQSTMSLEERASKLGEAVTLGYGVGQIVQFGKAAVTAAMDDARAQEELARQLQTSTGATKDQIAKVEDWIGKTQDATGVLDDELRPALATLVRSTKDVTQAQGLLQTAMDVSKGTGKDLETVSLALAKAHDGNVGALGRLGVATKDAKGETMTFEQVVGSLNKTFGGATAAAAETAAGKFDILRAKMSSLQENVGNALLPVVSQLGEVVSDVVGWFNSLSPEVQSAVTKLVMFGGGALMAMKALGAAKAAIEGFTAATKLSSAAMATAMGVAVAAAAVYIGMAQEKAAATAKAREYADALKAEKEGQEGATTALLAKKIAESELMKAVNDGKVAVKDLVAAIKGDEIAQRKVAADLTDHQRWTLGQLVMTQMNGTQIAKDLAKAEKEAGQQTDALAIAQRVVEPLVRLSAAASKRHADELTGEYEAAKLATKQFQDQESALRSLLDATQASIDSDFAYKRAQEDSTEALDRLKETERQVAAGKLTGKAATDAMKTATDDLVTSKLEEAKAYQRTMEDAAKATGATLTAEQSSNAYKTKLEEIAQSLKDSAPEVYAVIEGVIARMDLAFAPRNISYTVNGVKVVGDAGGGIQRIKRSALGNMLTAGEWSWVGESGPELVHVGAPAKVYSNQQSKRLVSSGPGRGGVTLNVYPARLNVDRHDLEQLVARAEALYAR